jgi:predicted methyltransferase
MNFLAPHKVVHHFDIKEGMYVADFTVGGGFFVIPLAERVGLYGKVYAVDRNIDLVKRIMSQGREQGHRNIVMADGDVFSGEMVLPDFVDMVLVTHALSRRDTDAGLFSHAYRHLKPEGKLVVIDYALPEKQSFAIVEYAGFVPHKRFHAGDFHEGIVFKKI